MPDKGNVYSSTYFRLSGLPRLHSNLEVQPSAPRRVLIFSRDNDTCVLLKTLLDMWGYEAEVADRLEKSLSIIEKNRPNLILVDSVLPFQSHLDNIRLIRRHDESKNIPIIVLSGFSQQVFRNTSLEVGADGFLVKPLDFDLLESFLEDFSEVNDQALQ